jgi:hypothetical protein
MAYQNALKNNCFGKKVEKRINSKYYDVNGVRTATTYFNKDERIVISFDQQTGDLITGDKQNENSFGRCIADNRMGVLKYILKWTKETKLIKNHLAKLNLLFKLNKKLSSLTIPEELILRKMNAILIL